MSAPQHDDQAGGLRQALAVAIVRGRRGAATEAVAWRAKAQQLEVQLAEQAAASEQLRVWASTLLRQHGTSPAPSLAQQAQVQQQPAGQPGDALFLLPPLALPAGQGGGGPSQEQHGGAAAAAGYEQLQRQLVLAAEAAGARSGAALDVLQGRAAQLADMLLVNVRMSHHLRGDGGSSGSGSGGRPSALLSGFAAAPPAAVLAALAQFATGTLLRAPASSLRTAYARHAAAMIAALLARPPAQPPDVAGAEDAPEALAVQALQLAQQLLAERAAPGPAGEDGGGDAPAGARAAAAAAMLQQLSALPGTALLLALALAQQLQRCVQQLAEANTAMAAVQLGAGCASSLALGEQGLALAAQLFEAAQQLAEELAAAVVQLPVWAVALADSGWAATALEDLVCSCELLFGACPALQQQQPLLADSVCQLCASLAASLQQAATNADAPAMRAGAGAALRSLCGALCLRLRDLFMPAAGAAGP